MKNKKETTLSVLKEIRDLLKREDIIGVVFPSLTAKEVVDQCENKIGEGKLLYYPEGWYKKEDFYLKEKTRKGKRTINLELLHKGKTWDECDEIAKKEGLEMLNFAEVVYLMVNVLKFRELLTDYNWTWTSSRSSNGGLVFVGSFGPRGLGVGSDRPGGSLGRLGVCFSRSISEN